MSRGQTLGSMVFNKPQLIALDEMQPIVNYLSNPNKTLASFDKADKEIQEDKTLADFDSDSMYQRYKLSELGINPDTMVGTLNVTGTLTYRAGIKNSECMELTSYENLKKQTESMVENGAKRIVLMVDSGGGMAHGNFSAANYISKMTKSAGIPTVAYVDGAACSGGLALAILADEVVLNPDSRMGSIGVVVSLYNDSKMLENAGVSRQFVFAGENKVPFDNDTGEFTKTFISDLQSSVDKTYTKFVKHVTSYRDISEQAVTDTQAGVFDADEAIRLGLADKIMELEDFELEYGLKVRVNSRDSSNIYELSGDNHSTSEGNMPDKKALQSDESLSDTHEIQPEAGLKDMAQDNMQLAELTKQHTELSNKYDEMQKQLAEYKELNEQLNAEVIQKELEARTADRTAKLEAALGKDNEGIAAMLANTESLSDEQFEGVASMLAGSQEAKAEQLAEHGGEGQESDMSLSLSEQIAQRAAKQMNARKA